MDSGANTGTSASADASTGSGTGADATRTGAEADAGADAAASAPPHGRGEALALFAFGLAAFWGISLLEGSTRGTFVGDVLPALGVLVWIWPAYVLAERRGHDPFKVHGLSVRPRRLGLALGVSLLLLLGYVGACLARFGSPTAPLHWGALLGALPYQIVFVALKEEYFFRGVLQPALERRGAAVNPRGLSWGIVIAAALFALAHVNPAAPNPLRLLTFFPALWFGWLRAVTGSIVPAILAHAAANLLQAGCLQAFGAAIG